MKEFHTGLCFFSLGLQEAWLQSVLLCNAFSGPQTLHFPPLCPAVTPLLAHCPLLPPAMAYDLIFWCPFFNLYAICQLPSGNAFHLKMSQLLVSWQRTGQTHLLCVCQTGVQTPEFLYTFVGMYMYVCLMEGGKEETRQCFAATAFAFVMETPAITSALSYFHKCMRKGQMQPFMWSLLNFTAEETAKLTQRTLRIRLNIFFLSIGVRTTCSLFKKPVVLCFRPIAWGYISDN